MRTAAIGGTETLTGGGVTTTVGVLDGAVDAFGFGVDFGLARAEDRLVGGVVVVAVGSGVDARSQLGLAAS